MTATVTPISRVMLQRSERRRTAEHPAQVVTDAAELQLAKAAQPGSLDCAPIDRAAPCAGTDCYVVILPMVVCWQLTINGRTTVWCSDCWPTQQENGR